jgi:hypothetical protein
MRELLTEVTDDISRRSVEAWRPAFGTSRARKEAETIAAFKCSDGVTPWSQAPMQVVWKASELLYIAVLEHARAAARLLTSATRGA